MGSPGTQNNTATLLLQDRAGKIPSFVTGRQHSNGAGVGVDLLCWSVSHTLHKQYLRHREFSLCGGT